MIQAEKLEQVLERKGYRVTKPESGDNLDSIDVLRSDHLKGAPPSQKISNCFNKNSFNESDLQLK